MLESYLIAYCSPTLASLKTASLFTLSFSSEADLERQLVLWNTKLGDKGVSLMMLRRREQTALIYVCRKAKLQVDLKKLGVAQLLSKYGYQQTDVEYALQKLEERLRQKEGFPHEIGIFLGYPLGDVVGFIQNAGKNSKCTGCWKVYCNECETVKLFARFRKCKDMYLGLWSQGRTVLQLTVVA
ncbi:MAG: DUF3793 family protein [Oscillospiraceae bacterium]|jgi:hypothetical protein